jgi:hypothetical protein
MSAVSAFLSERQTECDPLSLRLGPAGGTLAMGQRRQRVCNADLLSRFVSVLGYLTNFANYNGTYDSLGAVVWPHDLVVDIDLWVGEVVTF